MLHNNETGIIQLRLKRDSYTIYDMLPARVDYYSEDATYAVVQVGSYFSFETKLDSSATFEFICMACNGQPPNPTLVTPLATYSRFPALYTRGSRGSSCLNCKSLYPLNPSHLNHLAARNRHSVWALGFKNSDDLATILNAAFENIAEVNVLAALLTVDALVDDIIRIKGQAASARIRSIYL